MLWKPLVSPRVPPEPCADEQTVAQHPLNAAAAGEQSSRDTARAGRCPRKATNCKGHSQLQVFGVLFLSRGASTRSCSVGSGLTGGCHDPACGDLVFSLFYA